MPRDLIRLPDRTRRWSGQRAEYPEVRLAILWLGHAGCDDDHLVGGKAVNLSRLTSGYCGPARFWITPDLYQAWLATHDQGPGPNKTW